jgi:nucleoside-diphosphate-sugar epimerase
MKVLLAGASGAIGIPIARQLIAHDHEVLGLIRSHAGAGGLAALGARAVVADVLDRDGLLRAVDGLSADAVIHELTALRKPPLRHSGMTQTDRLRTEGSTNLLAAAEVLGAKRFVTQSIILGYGYSDHGDQLLTEEAPFGIPAGNKSDPHVAAMRSAERQAFTAPEGIALRYGLLYGGDAEQMRALLARRALLVTRGGLLGWVHHEDAARATVAGLEHGQAGEAYNIVDDRPASWQEVFTSMACVRCPAAAKAARLDAADRGAVHRLNDRQLDARLQREGQDRARVAPDVPHVPRGRSGHGLPRTRGRRALQRTRGRRALQRTRGRRGLPRTCRRRHTRRPIRQVKEPTMRIEHVTFPSGAVHCAGDLYLPTAPRGEPPSPVS